MDRQKGKMPGIRFRLHATRKHGIMPDKFFFIRYRRQGKDIEEPIGWASEGWNETKAHDLRAEIRENIRTGTGPQSLAEKRQLEDERREAEARRKLREAEARAAVEKLNKPFREVWTEYIEAQNGTGKKAGTIRTEKIAIEKWALPALGKLALSDITEDDLNELAKKMLEAGRAKRTIQYQMAIIRQIFSFGIDKNYFTGTPPTRKVIKKIKFDNKRTRWLKPAEAETLLEALKKRNIDLHDMALLSLHTGMRGGEIFKLQWIDVDFQTACLTLRDTKNTEGRFVYMSGPVKAMMERRKTSADAYDLGPLVFPGRNGQRIKDISRTFDHIVSELGLNDGIKDRRQKFSFHCLRHTAASWLVQAGTPMYIVQGILGHQTAKLTARYSHLAPGNFQAAAAFFNDPAKNIEAALKAANDNAGQGQIDREPVKPKARTQKQNGAVVNLADHRKTKGP